MLKPWHGHSGASTGTAPLDKGFLNYTATLFVYIELKQEIIYYESSLLLKPVAVLPANLQRTAEMRKPRSLFGSGVTQAVL
jgi:hypothetical protein